MSRKISVILVLISKMCVLISRNDILLIGVSYEFTVFGIFAGNKKSQKTLISQGFPAF